MNIAVYGFGRMGLTHYAILNQVVSNATFTIIDPNKKLNLIINKNMDADIFGDDRQVDEPFDYSFICSPPMFHIPTVESCLKRGDKNVFIEKPFGGNPDDFTVLNGAEDKCRIGYVLRFNPVIQWVKENVDVNDISEVEAGFYSNTIESKPKGWRNGVYSGVLNEMGSHIIDLMVYLFGFNEPEIIDKDVKSKISDVNDIVDIKAEEKEIKYNLHFDWINKSFRKPVFQVKLHLSDGSRYIIDQQKVEIYRDGNLQKKITAVDITPKVPFYLRGVDFTRQIMDFVGDKKHNATVRESLITRNLIRKILD